MKLLSSRRRPAANVKDTLLAVSTACLVVLSRACFLPYFPEPRTYSSTMKI